MVNGMVLVLFGIFVLLIALLIFMNSKKFRSLDSMLAEKIREHLAGFQTQSAIETFIPSLSITKSWKVDDTILGELILTASGETSKIARENLKYLYEMSNEHDTHCLKFTKEHQRSKIFQ